MTQTMTTTRQPRGWDHLVTQINAATERGAFVQSLLELQCRVVAAEYGAFWELDAAGKPGLSATWPAALKEQAAQNEVFKLLAQGAHAAFERGASHVFKIEVDGQVLTSAGSGAHLFITIMRVGGKPVACATVVADCRDASVISQTTPMRELAAGLYEGFFVRTEANLRTREAEQVRQAMAVLAVAQDGEGFHGAALNLVNELSRQLDCDRVALGWQKNRTMKLKALSDTDQVKRQSEEAGLLEMAMAECLDQRQPLLYPLPADAEPLLAQAVVFSHKRLVGGREDRQVASIPLRQGDDWVGVLTLERLGRPFDAALVQRLQLIADVAGPQLFDRYQSDRWLIGHAWRSVEKNTALLVGPKHVGWKLLGLTALVVLMLTLVVSWPYRITANFRLEAHNKRVLPAPYQGKLAQVLVQPGDKVAPGQTLAELDSTELRLQRVEAQSKLRQAQVEHDQAMAQGKQGDAARSAAQEKQYQAQVDLLNYQIDQAVIKSPVDGYVIEGFWLDKVGGVVDLGTNLFEIAPLSGLTPVLRVPEAEVDDLLAALPRSAQPLGGELATRSVPESTFVIHYDRIVPQGKPVDGANVFDVWCRLDAPQPWMRPGMEGVAKLDVGRRRLFWIFTHKILDTVRLWLWW